MFKRELLMSLILVNFLALPGYSIQIKSPSVIEVTVSESTLVASLWLELFGVSKREILVSAITYAVQSQVETKKQFETALEEFKSVVEFDGEELETLYNRLDQEYNHSTNKANSFRNHINKVEKASKRLFVEWEQEIATYDDSNLRQASNIKLDLKQLEKTIAKSLKIKLCLIKGSAKHDAYKNENETFEAYPLLILFHNIAWYLGFEFANGNDQGKYKFERLDRLKFFDKKQIEKQLKQDNTFNNNEEFDFQKSLKNLNKLYQSCPGIFLGDKEQQQNFLQGKSSATFEVELWFQNNIYTFILEGMKRYQGIQLTDPRKNEQLNILPIYKIQKEYASNRYDFALSDLSDENKNERKKQIKLENIFKLDTTGDEQFPNKFKVKFPRWFVRDYDFLRWILGFGKDVKVVQPDELKKEIKRLSQETLLNHVSKEQAEAISLILNRD